MTAAVNSSSPMDLAAINAELASASAQDVVRWAQRAFAHGLVMTTSFGAQAAVMLHLVTRLIPDIPVIWIDTGFNFPETYRFAEELTQRLKLNLKVYQSEVSPARMVALHGELWEKGEEGLDAYDKMRKVEPRDRAFRDLNVRAWLTGPRREQTEHRKNLRKVEPGGPFFRVHPILEWTTKDVHEYLKAHGLPYHPLYDQGYKSIGDWHSTTPIGVDQHERAGRFKGLKQECGLHLPASVEEDQSRASADL